MLMPLYTGALMGKARQRRSRVRKRILGNGVRGMFGKGEQVDMRRRAELASYAILDTPAEAEFNDIVKVASEVCGMPVSLISLLDGERQWFKAETGFGQSESPLSQSICAYAVQQDDVFEIEDLTRDARTADNPLVTGGPRARFYAGAPLKTPDGVALGALCVLDIKPNKLTASQAFVLRTLAHQVVTTLELRRSLRQRREADRRNKAILESAVDHAIVSMDLTGMVTSWSPGPNGSSAGTRPRCAAGPPTCSSPRRTSRPAYPSRRCRRLSSEDAAPTSAGICARTAPCSGPMAR